MDATAPHGLPEALSALLLQDFFSTKVLAVTVKAVVCSPQVHGQHS